MENYYRPIPSTDPMRPEQAYSFAGGPLWFSHAEKLSRSQPALVMPAQEVPDNWLKTWTCHRPPIMGISFSTPKIMGILNVTPDSFSDGGQYAKSDSAFKEAREMVKAGADIIDVGGESTRPGADLISSDVEIDRTVPVIKQISQNLSKPISIDTRKAAVAKAAVAAGAGLVNDVSGFTFDDALLEFCASKKLPVCVMHAQGDPTTMQDQPKYADVLLDIYDFLHSQIAKLVAAGIPKDAIIADPGIGFGKTLQHNLTLLNKISIFHGLGVPILLGASRKGFIGKVSGEKDAQSRVGGSIAAALTAVSQGVQIVRVHDVAQTRQAFAVWQSITLGSFDGA